MGTDFSPSRQDALDRLEQFLPRAGVYATRRNFDPGSEAKDYPTSRLSPFIRLRLIDESSVIRATLARYPYAKVEKFIQEVFWRTYWKGWLEMRPMAWTEWSQSLAGDLDRVQRPTYEAARNGSTGIECFDAWTRELRQTGYLHNHTRMWFASIWIFTLRLPWTLGAGFFEEYLLDGDPASNTLSWKWVAGLQTEGKHYLARATNIEHHTGGQWNPGGQLNENAKPLDGFRTYPRSRFSGTSLSAAGTLEGPIGYLCHPEDLSLPGRGDPEPETVAWGWTREAEFPLLLSEKVRAFRSQALERTGREIADRFGAGPVVLETTRRSFEEAVLDWVRKGKLRTVITPFAPTGGWQGVLERTGRTVKAFGCRWVVATSEWDRVLYPHATHGFFRFKKQIPQWVERLCS